MAILILSLGPLSIRETDWIGVSGVVLGIPAVIYVLCRAAGWIYAAFRDE